jgi:chromosome segregation ATPase
MEEALAKQGQARWGATWVSKEQYDRLVKALEAQRDQMSRLDAQYASARNTLASLDAQIKQAAADLDNYAQTINAYTARVLEYQGRSLDATYFMAQRDVAVQNYDRTSRYRAQLQAQFDQLAGGVRDFLAQAERLKAAYGKGGASGQYTGTQRILDWGETNSPPAPVPVAEPAPLPNPQAPSMVITPPPPPAPPVIVPYPVVVPVQGPATNPGHS